MKRTIICFLALITCGLPALAGSLATAARTVIPSEVQQIINVDYRRMKSSDTAMAMKNKLIPPNLKQFEDALKDLGINPDRDLEQITLAAFRMKDHSVQTIGVAQGQFPTKVITQRLSKQSIKSNKVGAARVYPMAGGLQMTLLDDWTLLFGTEVAMEAALDARDNASHSLNANREVSDMIASVDQGTVWSVLDTEGTQNMLRSILGPASGLAEFESVKKHVMGSRYSMDFANGVDFNLNVMTSDNVTAATLSSLLRAGIMLKKMDATGPEKIAMEGTKVDSDSGSLIVHFKSDDKNFQSLLDSQMFASVTH